MTTANINDYHSRCAVNSSYFQTSEYPWSIVLNLLPPLPPLPGPLVNNIGNALRIDTVTGRCSSAIVQQRAQNLLIDATGLYSSGVVPATHTEIIQQQTRDCVGNALRSGQPTDSCSSGIVRQRRSEIVSAMRSEVVSQQIRVPRGLSGNAYRN